MKKIIPVEATKCDTGHDPDIVRVYKFWSGDDWSANDRLKEVLAEAKVHYTGLEYVQTFAIQMARAVPWLERFYSLMWEIERDGKIVRFGEVYRADEDEANLLRVLADIAKDDDEVGEIK